MKPVRPIASPHPPRSKNTQSAASIPSLKGMATRPALSVTSSCGAAGFSTAQHVPALQPVVTGERLEPALHALDEHFDQLRQRYMALESECLQLEAQHDLLSAQKDELLALKEVENRYDDEMFKLQGREADLMKVRKQTQEVALRTYDAMRKINSASLELQELRDGAAQSPQEQLHQRMSKWYTQINGALSLLSGVQVSHFEDDMIHLNVFPRTTSAALPAVSAAHYTLAIKLRRGTTQVVAMQLTPADVPIDDLAEACAELAHLKVFLCELRSRIHNFLKRRIELAVLANRYTITCTNDSSVRVAFKNGFSCDLELDPDYPRPHSIIHMAKVTGPSQRAAQEADRLRHEWNSLDKALALSDLVPYVEQRLNALVRA